MGSHERAPVSVELCFKEITVTAVWGRDYRRARVEETHASIPSHSQGSCECNAVQKSWTSLKRSEIGGRGAVYCCWCLVRFGLVWFRVFFYVCVIAWGLMCTCMQRPEANTVCPPLPSTLFTEAVSPWTQDSPIIAGLASQLAPGSPICASQALGLQAIVMPPWHCCRFWGSNAWFSPLCSKCIIWAISSAPSADSSGG